jgi:hypothetical protein
MSESIANLLERMRSATGPDRELDRIIQVRIVNGGTGAFETEQAWLVQAARDNWNTPAYTASVDAALALVDKTAPGWSFKLVRENGQYIFVVRDAPDLAKVAASAVSSKPTAPLAILTALLIAMYMGITP